ncbi:MAG: LPS assembly lipoprotein LptE, partial [Prevotellaceae bacterium]|nr:LPS assembly lipoprotein LptE [Prevotellaceae bacterium]
MNKNQYKNILLGKLRNITVFSTKWRYMATYVCCVLVCVCCLLTACTVSYKLNGSIIDYSKTRSVSIADFPSVAESNPYVALPFEFSEKLRDTYTRQTKLQVLKTGGDWNLEGEITSLQLVPMAIAVDSYASQTKLTIVVRVRFSSKQQPEDDFEKTYSAFRQFDSNVPLNDALAELVPQIIEEITQSVF